MAIGGITKLVVVLRTHLLVRQAVSERIADLDLV